MRPMERVLVPAALPHLLAVVCRALDEHRDEVDQLNVFPVPDGDTGTNLAATARAVLEAAAQDPTPANLVRSALRSARGNSGVIFSQVVRAVVEAIDNADDDTPDVEVLALGLERADELARAAVAAPVEGTILSALRAAAIAARKHATAETTDLDVVLGEVTGAVSQAVRDTRDQLEVLREAGVVDAGARGFEVVMAALHSVVRGEEVIPAPLDRVVPRCVSEDLSRDNVRAFPFEVQFLVDGDAAACASLRAALAEVGDSVVVVDADGLISAHVHTPDVDAAVAAAGPFGGAREVRITDLREQVAESATLAVVAVVPIGGLTDLASGSGAALVAGAAGQLPSVEDLLRAARTCPGTGPVVVLPGHPNVVPTARQAAALSRQEGGRELLVVTAADHPLVVLSCLALGSADLVTLTDAAASCRAGEVVAAVRDANTPVGEVLAGQPVVVVGGDVVAIATDVSQGLAKLLAALDAPSAELVTVAVGAEADVDTVQVMMATAEHAGEAEIDVLDGGQRPALLLVAVEE